MTGSSSLLSIIAYARSGALDHAWRLFREAGLENVTDDPAVLSVRGRLLKDRALAAEGATRRRLYLEAAEAYRRAGEFGSVSYPLINAATLSLLAGRREQAHALARQVLAWSSTGEDESETPYYRAATQAEALLLLGEIGRAKSAIAEAIFKAPKAFEDHASTLRQFGLILGELGEDMAWLDPLRPPRTLHFAGHMGVAAKADEISRQIPAVIDEERIGFGYGALAAGADILVAESLLEHGAELHVILPCQAAAFRDASVSRFGEDWAARFDRILEAADTVEAVTRSPDPPSALSIQLAAEVAMGRAVMQADVLMTEAVQLLILDRSATAGGSDRIGLSWVAGGRRQHVLVAPRVRRRAATSADDTSPGVCLAAMVRIDLASLPLEGLPIEALSQLADVLTAGPAPTTAPRWTGDAVLVGFDTPSQAAHAALSVAAALEGTAELSIGAHYGIAQRVADPFGGQPFLVGPATNLPGQVTASTPAGAVHVTEDFAAVLSIGPVPGRPGTEFVGELPVEDTGAPIRLFSLKR